MATKSTGGVPKVGVESWSPQIKSPGIKQGTGAYATGDQGEMYVDYGSVNDDIQKSIKDLSSELGKFLGEEKLAKTITPEMAAELGIPIDSVLTRREFIDKQKRELGKSGKEAREAWRNSGLAEDPVDLEDMTPEEKKAQADDATNAQTPSGESVSQAIENEYSDAAKKIIGPGGRFNKLSNRQKKAAKKELTRLAKSKETMNTLMADWIGADVNDITWRKYNSHPKVREFMQYMISGKAAESNKPFTFDMAGGGTIKFGDKTVSLSDLEAGRDIYKTAGIADLRKATQDFIDTGVTNLVKAEDKVIKAINDQSTTPIDPNFKYDRGESIRSYVNAEFTEAEYEDIWETQMKNRFKDARYIQYDPAKHRELVQKYVINEINNKMGTQVPELKSVSNLNTNNKGGLVDYGGSKGIGQKEYENAVDIVDRLFRISQIRVTPQGMNAETMPSLEGKIPSKNSEKEKDKKLFRELDIVWNTDPETGERETGFSSGALTDSKLKAIIQHGVNNSGDFSNFEANSYPEHSQKVYEAWAKVFRPADKLTTNLPPPKPIEEMTEAEIKDFETALEADLENLLKFTNVGDMKNIKDVNISKNKAGQTVLTLKYPASDTSNKLIPQDYIIDLKNPNSVKEIFGDLLKDAKMGSGSGINANALFDFILEQEKTRYKLN